MIILGWDLGNPDGDYSCKVTAHTENGILVVDKIEFEQPKPCPCGKKHCGKIIIEPDIYCELEFRHEGDCGIHPIS